MFRDHVFVNDLVVSFELNEVIDNINLGILKSAAQESIAGKVSVHCGLKKKTM